MVENLTKMPEVRTRLGILRGRKVTTKTGVSYYSFQGIPYAKPPIGSLRFQAPQPADQWNGIREAFSLGSVAPQYEDMIHYKYIGEEDCLYLNIYTPKIPTSEVDQLKAVMVWIHGGAFVMDSGGTDLYEPDHLLMGDVVLVTLNYRLGALGFLSTQDSATSGNNGLKDQVMALRWVQQNIAQFGGDPGNVTIFGQSAGGACVHYHLLSPMSKGLFHKAIAQSGSALSPGTFTEDPRERAFRLGKTLGCTTTDSRELVEFLRAVPARQLVYGAIKSRSYEEKALLQTCFIPHVDKGTNPEDEVFLPAKPIELTAKGRFHKVPFMTGITSKEGMLFLRYIIKDPTLLNMVGTAPELFVPPNYKLQRGTPKSKEIANKIKHFYFAEKPLSKEILPQIADFYSDIIFINAMVEGVMNQIQHTTSPIYAYRFSFDQELGFIKKLVGDLRLPGVSHLGELPYLFKGYFIDDEKLKPDSEYMKMVRKMVKLWTNFAKTGNPTPEDDPEIGIKWNPVSKINFSYLNIDKQLSMQPDFASNRIKFWKQLRSSL